MALRRLDRFKNSKKKTLMKTIKVVSHLNEHKFRHNFNDTINPMCNCGAAAETTVRCLLRCRLYSVQRAEHLNDAYREVLCFTHIIARIAAWLLLTFFHMFT